MPDFENAFKIVCELVKDFKENEHRYLSPQYQEAEVRRDFIDKLFEALGWDVYHCTQKNPYEQEVKVEKGVNVGKAQKRADYAFYISPEFRQPKFFAEAKKPCRNLKNADDYFQTIRYGWNANTPIAVLTDFEEFHILDCRFKPNINNVLENPNHKSYVYTDYTNAEKFKEIYYLFSRNEVANNSLEKYSDLFQKVKGKTKTSFKSTIQAIDDDFLEYIDEVRETLAKAFKKTDSNLTSEELTEATQRTIDRIVFIRFLEDKLIEPEYYISEFGKKGNSWNEFITVCKKLDAKYNGIVFKKHFIDEQNFQGPEQNTFKKICDEISYLNSPYDFNAIPIHILGSIYERFLGKVVNATAQRVKVEEKPEVRKAGGVYYTPKYIVDYIVENTVGKILINKDQKIPLGGGVPAALSGGRGVSIGKTPAEISKLRFADIACGSGSFLIGVFETLLKYHTEYYQAHPEQAKKDGCINKGGQWILSIKQKQNILLNNIYGVDIDNQAVEVTQLSLALKMLEDESTATANEMQVLFHEKILPDLSKNIVCGNSLIGTDILQGKMFPSEEERKLNPMDFETTFPEIMKNGGFDAIVGNPPYVLGRETFDKNTKLYISVNFFSYKGKYDLYVFFVEKALSILKSNGKFSYIIPNTILANENATKLRQIILEKHTIEIIKPFKNRVFENAQVETVIIVISNYISGDSHSILIDKDGQKSKMLCNYLTNRNFKFNISNDYLGDNLQDKITQYSIRLGELTDICIGIQLGGSQGKSIKADFLSNIKIDDTWKSVIDGKDFNTYSIKWENKYVHYGNWLHRKRDEKYFLNPKIIIRQIGKTPIATFDNNGYYTLNTIYNIITVSEYSLQYILAIINSNIGKWYWSKNNSDFKSLFPKIKKSEIESILIPIINFDNKTEKLTHNKIVSLVEQMLEAKKQLQNAKTDRDKTYYERRCNDLDSVIDSEIYKLYGLTEEEIKIVEGKY